MASLSKLSAGFPVASLLALPLTFFALTLCAVLALMSAEAADMVAQWTWSSSYHHGWLAAPIAIYLLVEARGWRTHPPRFDAAGGVLLIFALVICVLGRAMAAALLGHVSVVMAIIGGAVLTLGREYVRKSATAFGFLIFMVPFGESLIPALQDSAAVAVATLLNVAGVETLRDGVILSTAAGRFEMAESCAGLRFLLAAIMISALAGRLAFTGWRRRAVFIAGALALAVVANWVRAFGIIAAATATEMQVGTGPEHVAFGWLLYVSLLLGLLLLARRFSDRDRAEPMAPDAPIVG
jgi:exosortase